ncbi:MAG: ribonuclease HII [Candidatus Liptonbacteria bacterium]|nr:ribonuclease HII [Candidatus Liptonbacteria bacterium]
MREYLLAVSLPGVTMGTMADFVIGIDEVGRAASKRASPHYIIGIDEVGRGSLAGPVAVAAVAIPRELRIVNRELGKLRDSKKLTPLQRERWAAHVKAHPQIAFAVARVYPRGVERLNISRAANKAALKSLRKLLLNCELRIENCVIKLDGGLYLGDGKQPENVKTVIKGDEKFNAVKLASIVAKVSRDRYMKKLHKKHPQYGFAVHKGYATRGHIAALKEHGISPVHRLTFLKKYPTIMST